MPDFNSIINLNDFSIWRYQHLYPPLHVRFRLTAGEGNTQLLEKDSLFFKREDLNPSGSIKDRGVATQLSYALSQHHQRFVISSSGNAGISMALYAQKYDLDITVFVSPRIVKGKLDKLRQLGANIEIDQKPLRRSLQYAKKTGSFHLRQSRDPFAWVGFSSLGFELFEHFGEDLSSLAIFFPVSSGATIVGVSQAFHRLVEDGFLPNLPQLHLVQTTFVHPIAEVFHPEVSFVRDEKDNLSGLGLASALCARQTPLRDDVINLVKSSGGWGWVVTETEIDQAWGNLRHLGLETSAEGAVALAGFYLAQEKELMTKQAIILLTGKLYE